MKTNVRMAGLALVAAALLGQGCSTQEHTLTNPNHPGPAIGHAVGTGAGVVAGNAAGMGVAAGEGFVRGASAPFSRPTQRTVRRWETVKTEDGRTIQVPVEIPVDEYGRVIYQGGKKR